MKREFVFWKDYFNDFFKSLDEDSRRKVIWMLKSLESLPKIPRKFFKHIEGVNGLFELRISWEEKAYHIFCFFDKGNKIILCNGFIKKDQKTLKQEIIKAIKIKEEYRYENEK
jgi:phage-related protein